MTSNLDTLRKIAEAATPGPWHQAETGVLGAREDWDLGKGPARIMEAQMPWRRERMEANAKHVATFDPETVLALLSRLEQAEQQRDSAREACKTLAEVLSKHSEWIVEATDSQDLIGDDGDGDWDVVWDRVAELGEGKRKAEQAVARVREVCESDSYDMHKDYGNGELAVPVDSITNALDGDQA
ncbi:ead/Ea22-like family protein [Glutamicibacter sp.]|uniref:ead/Ea22-like family protein n=1 Tax=Glutamicibacter sp. TaxID=1931995 RepID=UPI003D6C66EB